MHVYNRAPFLLPPPANPVEAVPQVSGLVEVILVESCKRNYRVEVSMHNVLLVQMDQQCEFRIMLVVALTIVLAKEDRLPPFTMLSITELV